MSDERDALVHRVNNLLDEHFEELALDIFKYQSEKNKIYGDLKSIYDSFKTP